MNVLVTGASGFVGSHLVNRLLQSCESVTALVRERKSSLGFVRQVVGNVLDVESLKHAVEGIDVVFHCAAAVGPQFSKSDIYKVNLKGVKNLIESALPTKPYIVFVSSVTVLGTRSFQNVSEDEPCRYSNDPAADVKIDAEFALMEAYNKHALPITILRPGMIYGPGDPHNLPKLVSALSRGKFKYIASKENLVPMVHVADLAEALVLAAKNKAVTQGRKYHVLSNEKITIERLVKGICGHFKFEVSSKIMPYWIPAAACKVFGVLKSMGILKKPAPIAPNSLRFLGTSRSFNLSRSREELGFTATRELEASLSHALEGLAVPEMEVSRYAPA